MEQARPNIVFILVDNAGWGDFIVWRDRPNSTD